LYIISISFYHFYNHKQKTQARCLFSVCSNGALNSLKLFCYQDFGQLCLVFLSAGIGVKGALKSHVFHCVNTTFSGWSLFFCISKSDILQCVFSIYKVQLHLELNCEFIAVKPRECVAIFSINSIVFVFMTFGVL